MRARRVLTASVLLALGPSLGHPAPDPAKAGPPLPTKPSSWLGPPQTWHALRGRVVLVFVWTFG